ncbi:uncharacterized protein LOC119374209 [Rhipicephalus sanguineus]|uniref:uncharacterized protein LOC119374209 n=1 Tax=Rhipicephalus sanguineus TaxID=34632 RepID=UPI001895D05D|nr:uncharacterized protein LOC119374209 [Rhipicephalus sanguineus]
MEPIEVTSESDSLLPKEPCVASMSTPPRSVGKNKSGHILNSDSRNMIFHCYTYWRNRVPVRSVEDTSKFVAEMLGVSESTVFKVRREAKASSSSGGNLSTPSRKRPRNAEKRRRSTKYDSFTLCALRSCVHDFFRRNEIPTVEKITNEFSNRMDLPSLKRCTVRRLLAEIRFKYEKRCRNSLLIDRDDIVEWRNRYLRDVERYREEGRKIFLDETWVTSGHTQLIVWTDTVVQKRGRLYARANGLSTGLKQPSGKGQRLIVTHIGSEDGFVDGCLDVFRGRKTGDYHEEMDGNRFEGWFGDVLQKLPAGSVIVLGNAPYHSRREEKLPTTSWKKENIQEWLNSKDTAYSATLVKRQLLELVASVKPRFLSYIIDNAAARAGCVVPRLPPYHCEFNPIELVWAKVKNGIAADNRDFKLCTVEDILREKIKNVTAEDWRKNIRHVMELEAKFRVDTSGSDHVQPIVIQLGEDDTEESDSDCELSGIEPLEEA